MLDFTDFFSQPIYSGLILDIFRVNISFLTSSRDRITEIEEYLSLSGDDGNIYNNNPFVFEQVTNNFIVERIKRFLTINENYFDGKLVSNSIILPSLQPGSSILLKYLTERLDEHGKPIESKEGYFYIDFEKFKQEHMNDSEI